MAEQTDYDQEFERILKSIAIDNNLTALLRSWEQPGRVPPSLPEMVNDLLRYRRLVLVCEWQGQPEEALKSDLRECFNRHNHLYDLLVTQLYITQAGKPLNHYYYTADGFLVLDMVGHVAPVIGVMGRVIAPFVIRHYRQPYPGLPQLLQLAAHVLKALYTEPVEPLQEQIAEQVEPLLDMPLRPLPLFQAHVAAEPITPPPDSLPESTPPAVDHSSNGHQRESLPRLDVSDDDPPPDTGPISTDTGPAEPRNGSRPPRRTMRAPLPYDWEASNGHGKT